MKTFTLLFLIMSLLYHTHAQSYTPKDDKQAVNFTIKNFGIAVNGNFRGLQGNIIFNPTNLAAAAFKVTVDAATVNTGNGARDEHLKKEDYFNTASFQKISIVSSKIKNGTSQGAFIFEGVVNIKGVNRIISFPFTAVATTEGYQFTGSFKINRRDFKVGGNSLVLSDNLLVNLNISAKKN
jgi:polyisoprenoid-binding protein YceI